MAFMVIGVVGSAVQQSPAPEGVLRSTAQRLVADLDRMPRYTCVQTITRSYYRPIAQGRSCAVLMKEYQKHPEKHESRGWDRLRLEVAIAGGDNVYSWVGAPRFDSDAFEQLAGRGPLSSGDFGPFLSSILNRGTIAFTKEETAGGRRLFQYSYDLPLERSRYMVKEGEKWVPTAYSGTLMLDPESNDIANLTVRTAELPEKNLDCQANSEVEYGRTQIHDRMVLIPRQTSLITIVRDGSETESRTVYSSCREYASKSRLFIDPSSVSSTAGAIDKATGLPGPPASSNSKSSKPDAADSASDPTNSTATPSGFFPSGLHFRARVITPIDSDTAAAGDAIEAVLRTAIVNKNKRVLAPAGAILHGRVMSMEQHYDRLSSIWLSIQFESIQVNGRSVPFSAAPDPGHNFEINAVSNPWGSTSGALDPDAIGFAFYTQHLRLTKFDWDWKTLEAPVNSGQPAR